MFTRKEVEKIKSIGTPETHLFVEWLYGFNPQIRRGLEIGVSSGGSLACWQVLLEPDGILIGIDFNVCDPVYGWIGVMEQAKKRFENDSRIHLLTADSRKEETVEKVKELLGGKLLDFLYIDGEHSIEVATSDYDLYSPLVKENGIIAFHDATKNSNVRKATENTCKVFDLRESKKVKYICQFDSRKGHCGILAFVKGTLE